MSYSLHWTTEAKKTFDQNLEYLAKEWSNEVINTFLDRVEIIFDQLAKNPEIYPIQRAADNIHKCVVHKRIVLYYRINNKQIDLLTFWNTYQNPDKIKL